MKVVVSNKKIKAFGTLIYSHDTILFIHLFFIF